MPPEYDINDTYNTTLQSVKHALIKCKKEIGKNSGVNKIINKLYVVLEVIEKYKYNIDARFSDNYQNEVLFIIFNLGLILEIISSYSQEKNLTKGQMIDLNGIYRKYKK